MARGIRFLADRKYTVALIVALTSFTAYLHYSTIPQILILHDIYREFFYIPVLLSALVFGLKGSALTFLLIVLLYTPWIVMHWTGDFIIETNRFVQLTFVGIVALLSGLLISRDRKQRTQMEKEHYLALVGQMATTIVHDLKNPLITILGFGRRFMEGKEDPETAIPYMLDSARVMLKIVHDVLDFAKPLKLNKAERDLREIISKAVMGCNTKAESECVSLSLRIPSEPLPVSVDSFQLERAVVNLISNAIEASQKEQRVSITVSQDKEHAMLAVQDKGAGMSRETVNNIFTPFFTTKGGGTGLGMPIAKKVIDGHNGKIYIYSQPGEGTEVKILIPLIEKAKRS